MDKSTILVVEDNGRLRRFVSSNLKKNGYNVLEADSGKAAFEILKKSVPDLILLDLRLGDSNGIDILKTIRRQDELPVIIVSSIDSQNTKIDGFNIGCDDYITKPFYIEELLVRVKRLLERTEESKTQNNHIQETITSGPFTININSLSIYKNGKPIIMRKKLFEIFLFFVQNPEMIISYELLFNRIWGASESSRESSLYVHIRNLRSLIEDDPSKPKHIKTVKNSGYIYTPGA